MTTKKCIGISTNHSEFISTNQDPDEGCINCILDDILNTPEGDLRDFWINWYKQGLMRLNCGRTGKSYTINKEFFDKIFKNL